MPIAGPTTDRIDLAAQSLYASDTDDGKREFIRVNIEVLSKNPTFWLPEGTEFYGEPFTSVGASYLLVNGGFLLVGGGRRLRL